MSCKRGEKMLILTVLLENRDFRAEICMLEFFRPLFQNLRVILVLDPRCPLLLTSSADLRGFRHSTLRSIFRCIVKCQILKESQCNMCRKILLIKWKSIFKKVPRRKSRKKQYTKIALFRETCTVFFF